MAALLGCAFSSLEKYCKINHSLENFVTTLLSSFISVTLMKRHSLLWHCQHPWPHHFHLPHRSGKVRGGKERKIRGKMPPQATLVCVDSMLKKITVNRLLTNTPMQQPLFLSQRMVHMITPILPSLQWLPLCNSNGYQSKSQTTKITCLQRPVNQQLMNGVYKTSGYRMQLKVMKLISSPRCWSLFFF